MISHSVYDTLFYKRKSYQHENELRLVIVASRIHAWKLQKLFEIQGISANQWQKRMDILEKDRMSFLMSMATSLHVIYISLSTIFTYRQEALKAV